MNLAYVSPLPPLRSGIADYAAALLPHLRPHVARLTVVTDGYVPHLPAGLADAWCGVDGEAWGRDSLPLYHMGSHLQYHRAVYRALCRHPGVVILHDGNLLPFIHELTLSAGNRAGFLRQVGLESGAAGIADAWTAIQAGTPLSLERHALLSRVARASLGVVVHSRCLQERLRATAPQARVAVLPHLDLAPPGAALSSRSQYRAELGLDSSSLIVGLFGYIAPVKRLEPLLAAFARLRTAFPHARLLCVGQVVDGYDLAAVDELGLQDVVRVTGYVPQERFLRYLSAVDVGVNLRYPTWGEASGALLRLMACGVPTLVTDAGAFSELPDDVVLKVPIGPDEVAAIEVALRALLGDAGRRSQIGRAARDFVAANCSPPEIGRRLVGFLHAAIAGEEETCTSFT
ncbi:MAG: glycosyltransferase family 4 protein [Anaerolineae bacterium]|nr:glycosyltransferase family 4 protein [Anaerolineae bacterium]